MKKFPIDWQMFFTVLAIFGLVTVFPIFAWLRFNKDFAAAADYAQLIMAAAAIVAVMAFVTELIRNRIIAVIDLITFYRTEILETTFDEIIETIKSSNSEFNFRKLRAQDIEKIDYLWLYENRHDELNAQEKITEDRIIDNRKMMRLMNKLEEFSLRLIHLDISSHPGMLPLKESFVEMVEIGAFYIARARLGKHGIFDGVERIYMQWKNDVSRLEPHEITELLRKEIRKHLADGTVKDLDKIVKRISESKKNKK